MLRRPIRHLNLKPNESASAFPVHSAMVQRGRTTRRGRSKLGRDCCGEWPIRVTLVNGPQVDTLHSRQPNPAAEEADVVPERADVP